MPRTGRVVQRVIVWTLVTVVVTVTAFWVGTLAWERRNCGGPEVTDCDLGFVLGGALWAGLALLGMAAVIASVEVWRRRRRPQRVSG